MGKPNISRTYEKKSATAVVNSLFARNITKRKTEKIKQKKVKRTVQKICISDLPPVDHNHHLLNDSFKNDSPITDLFDQIKRTEVYNPVNLKPTVHYFSSDSEVSKNYKTDSIPLISIINPTPVKREKRPRKITTKRKNKEFIKHSKHCVHNRNSSTKEQKTLDKSVNVELSIENELQKNIEYNTLNITCSKLSADNDVLGPFIELARPQKEQFVDDTIYVTSTPLETYRRKIDYSCLSPILAKSKRFTSQSVGLSSIDCLVEKSLDEIRKWDYVVPDFSYSVPKNNSTTKGMMFGNSRKSFISANNSLKSVLEVPRRRKTIDYSSLNSTSLLKPVTKKNRRTSCIGFNANGDRLSNCCKEKPIRLKECCVKLKYCVELEKRIDWKLNCSPFVKLDYLIDILGINTSISWSNLKDSTNENSTNSSINLRINKRNVKIKNKQKKYRKGRLPLKVLKNIKKKKKTSKKNIFKSSFRYEEDKPYHLPQNKDVISNNLGLLKRSLTKKYNKLLDKLPSNIHKKFIKQPHVALMRNRELEYCLVNRKTRNSSRRPTLFLSKDASTKRSKNKNIYSDICSLDKEISVIVDDIVNTSQNCPTNFITLRRKLKGNNDIIGDLVKTPLSTSRQTKCNEKMYNSNGLLNKRITGIDLRRSVSLKTFDVDNCSDNETDQSHYPVNIVKSDCTSKPKEPLHISKKLNNDIAKLLQSPLSDYVKSKCLNNLNASVKYNSSSDLFDSKSDLDLSECTSPDSATEKYLLNNSSLNVHITQDKMVKKCFKSQNSTISQTEYVDLPSTCSTVKDLVDMSTQTDDLFCISDCVYVPFVKPRSIEKTQNSSAIVENMEDVDFVIEISHNSASNELKNIENTIALKQLNREDPLFVENCIEKLREYVVNPISNSSLITQKGNVTHRSKEKKIVENVIDLNNSCSGNVNDDLNRIENIIATKDVSKCDSLRAENCVEEPKEFVVDPASNSSFITQQGKITHRSKEKKIVEKVIDLNNSCSDNENNDFSCTENITASKEVNKDDFFHVENCIEEPKKSIVEPVRNNTQQDKICRRSKEKRTMENVIDLNNSCNINENDDFVMPIQSLKPQTFTVKTGKSYKRSLSCLRRSSSQLLGSTVALRDGGSSCSLISNISDSRRRLSKVSLSQGFKGFPKSGDTLLQTFAVAFTGIIPDNTQNETLEEKFGRISVNEPHNNDNQIDDDNDAIVKLQQPLPIQFAPLSAKDQAKAVVFEKCRQTEPLPFSECYPDSILQNCFKIGEGVYGEVFQFRGENGKPTVMKIIPIEGDQLVNGEVQKKFEEIMTEIVIAMELSSLRNNNTNITNTFSELQRVRCVKGRWPARLLDLWDLYDEDRKSENDSPEIFGEDQLYITLELANGGRDLEAFGFTNALQAFSVFQQVSCALAVAEESLEFEHRDLHWGNVLVSIVDHDKTVSFVLNGKNITLETYGVEASIIDFTLSRITKSNCCIFTDVSNDLELFTAEGDYQFEIYRLMKKRNGNEWEHFEPYTNVLWLHYLLDKAVTALRYRSTKSKLHKEYIRKLRNIKDVILEYTSVKDYVINNFQFTF